MKKLLLLAALALGLVNVHAQTLGQTMYIDFGPSIGKQGATTSTVDANGHYWNNPINVVVGSKTTIINGANIPTEIEMEVTDNFSLNTTENFGPGSLDAPQVSIGDLGILTAYQDYFYVEGSNPTGQLVLRNLNPAKHYKFSVFGSRITTGAARESKYEFIGATTVSGTLLTNDNRTNLYTTTLIAPSSTNTVTLNLSIISGNFAYLNILKIEEYTLDVPAATAIQSFCVSNNPTVANLNATGVTGSTLKWYTVATAGTALTATTALVSGKYYVSQTINGTESTRTTVDVVLVPTPATPVITAQTTATFCAGGNVVLQSNTSEGASTYQWYKDATVITGATSQNYTATTAGNYTVVVATTGSCASAASTAVAVTINALPVVAAITGTTNIAKNGTSQLASVTTGGVWSSSNTAIATVSATGKVTAVAPGTTTIAYTVTANGCSGTASVELTVNNGEILEQSMYIDFGPNVGNKGAITPSPDVNGHYWNNPINGALGAVIDILNSNNADTGIDMEVTDNFVVNISDNYGPTVTTGLNDLGIATATQDYFYLESSNPTGQLKFKNLDASKGYKFTVFASRPNAATRKTNYEFAGLDSFTGQIQTSNGTSDNLNLNGTLTTSILTPNAAGEIIVSLSIAQDVFGYINVIKIDQYSNLSTVKVTAIAVTGNDITVSGQTSQMTATVTPTDATFKNVSWSVDKPSVAIISATGVLTPVSNGTVVVKATSAQSTDVFGTKTITVSNQATSLYFSGTATENGNNVTTALPLHMVTGLNGTVSSTFEIYTSLNETGTFNFYTSQEAGAGTVYGAGATAGTIAGNGAGIDPTESGPVVITVNTATNTYTITPIAWSVVGSSILNAWEGDAPLTYKGKGVWQGTIDMSVVSATDSNPRFVFKANKSWDYVMKKVAGSKNSVIKESTAKEFGVALQDIDLKYGNFIITLDLSNYTYGIECTDIDENKISFMGSSVMNGTGATNMHGYAYKYEAILAERAKNGSPAFYRSNISIGGNNTTALLNRFEKDLVGDCSNYVIFGLALGNEGLHETGQVANDSYKANTQLLIQMARDINKVPVVMNSYVRNDYNATDYEFVKQTNLLMAQWDVPTVNTLGATDNGSGNWVTGYWSDSLHPNDAGHAELSYAIVPSLFDALDAKKPQPVLATGTYVTPDAVKGGGLVYTPDAITHSFTVSFDVKTTATGNLMAFTTTNINGTIAIDANGFVKYTAPAGGTITGTVAVNNDAWHKITLTHYYARSETLLYTDAVLTGKTAEKLEPKVFTLHGAGAPANVSYGNWFFYRSGMNDLEIAALNDGKMLKSSLELYAPLDGESDAPFVNLAQSTTAINATNFTLGTGNVVALSNNMKAYPNPVKDVLTVDVATNLTIDTIEVYNPLGMLVTKAKNVKTINMSTLSAGVYLVKVSTANSSQTIKVIKQ